MWFEYGMPKVAILPCLTSLTAARRIAGVM
jgi:hypothetical protein